jgi:hypothetical protein
MSLVTTSSQITINKPNGQEMFNSDSKFIYYKRSASGTLTMNDSAEHQVSYPATSSHEFTMKFVTISSSTGNGTDGLVGLKLPIDSGLLLHVLGYNKDDAVAAYSIALTSREHGGYVKLKQESSWHSETTYINLTLSYHFITYAYL